jgi:hypothetical protein
VPEEQRVTVDQVRRDGLGVQPPLSRVGHEHDDDVGLLTGVVGGEHPQPLRLGLGAARRALRQADPDVDARVAQRQRVGVALAAVAEHGHLRSWMIERSASSS